MKRFLALLMLALGWLAIRGRQIRTRTSGAAPAPGQGGNVLTETAADVRAAAGQAQQVASNVARSTRETSRNLAGQVRSAVPGSGGSGSDSPSAAPTAPTPAQAPQAPTAPPAETSPITAMAASEQPPDDSMVVLQGAHPEEAFPEAAPQDVGASTAAPEQPVTEAVYTQPQAEEIPSETYASESTGPEDATTVSATTTSTVVEVADDMPDPLQAGAAPTSATDSEGPGATITGAYTTTVTDEAIPEPGGELIFRAGEGDSTITTTSAEGTGETAVVSADASSGSVVVDQQDEGFATTGDEQMVTDSAATQSQGTGDVPEEGLLLAPDAAPISSTTVETSDTQYGGSVTTSTGDASGGATQGGVVNTGDRIYNSGQDSQPGPADTQDTATEIGRPGPVADAKREELQSLDITPPGMTSTAETYERVEVSLPPETLAAMQNPEQGAAQTLDLPIREGYDVQATDGKVGSVCRVVRPEGGAENYMVVKAGLVFKSDVQIPFSAVDRIEGDTVYLNIEKQYIKVMEGQDTTRTGDTTATMGVDRGI